MADARDDIDGAGPASVIKSMEASIAASRNAVIDLHFAKAISTEDRVGLFRDVDTGEWYRSTLQSWVGRHCHTPALGYWDEGTGRLPHTTRRHGGQEEGMQPRDSGPKDDWRKVKDWVHGAWIQLGHTALKCKGKAGLTENLVSAIVAETGVWCIETYYAFEWAISRPRPRFPCLQGAGGHVYLSGQAPSMLWLYDDRDEDDDYGDGDDVVDKYSSNTAGAHPCYPVAAFPSWDLKLPAGTTRVGERCDGFYCPDLLPPDVHREVTKCCDALRDAQGECVVPQYTMILDPNMHLAEAKTPGPETHLPEMGKDKLNSETVAYWAATPFAVVPNGGDGTAVAARLGPINALEDRRLEKRTGAMVETILSAAAPMLAALRRPSLLLPGPLQVVCKAQRIFLQPNEVYEGVWHVDGDGENVVAVILYYYRYSKGIVGGDIEFVGKESSDLLGDGDCSEADEMHSASDTVDKLLRRGRAPIAEGTCVVFSNHQLVHRILTMFNSSECDTANRDFVALFVVDQREPVGTTLQPEVLPSDEDRLVLDGSKYLDGDRSTTFADRDHRRRLRLFDQLTPKTTFNFDSTVNGQTAYSTGNGSLAWIGWANGTENETYDMDEFSNVECASEVLGHATQPAPLNRGLSYAAEIATRHFPLDVDVARPQLMVGRVDPNDIASTKETSSRRSEWQIELPPIAIAIHNDSPELATLLLQHGARMVRCVPRYCGPRYTVTQASVWAFSYEDRDRLTRLGVQVEEVVQQAKTGSFKLSVLMLAMVVRNVFGLGATPIGTERRLWDEYTEQQQKDLADLGWSAYTHDQVYAFTTNVVGAETFVDEATANRVAKEYLSSATFAHVRPSMSTFLSGCRFDSQGLARHISGTKTVNWTTRCHRYSTVWARKSVLTLMLIAGRQTICGTHVPVPREMWYTVLSMLRPFELGDRKSYTGPRNEELYYKAPSEVYTGPLGDTADAWTTALAGQYTTPAGSVEVITVTDRGILRWATEKYGDLTLELTANPRRLKVKDRHGEGKSYSLSMLVEVTHDGGPGSMGTVSELVLNGVDHFVKAPSQ